MFANAALVLSLLAVSARAAPGTTACNADNCLRAVRASSAKPFPSQATADCSSFLRKTVTPCSMTATATTTVTATAAPTTVTMTTMVSQTQLTTVVQTVSPVVTTIEDTVTFIQPTEVDVTNTIFTTVTQTAAPLKRAVDAVPLPAVPTIPAAKVKARIATTTAAAGTCAATTGSPTGVPTYASACSGTARYSSACSCAGITATTTTLPQGTVTTTSTVTSTFTPTSTVTSTVTNTVPVTVSLTQTVPVTFETTDATAIVPSAFTVTTNVVVPTTVTVAPACTGYHFVSTSGPRAGQFIEGGRPDPNAISYGFIDFTNAAGAQTFSIHSDGRVYSSDGVYRWITDSDSLYYILQMTPRAEGVYGNAITPLYCSINSAAASYPGSIGTLACTSSGHPVTLVYCDSVGNYLLQTTESDNSGCQVAGLEVIPAAC